MLTLGCHLSKREGCLFMAKEAVSINANTFQYFTRNPRGGAVAKLDQKDLEDYDAYAKEHGIAQVCGYAPYDVEPANPDAAKRDFTLMVMSEDLARLEEAPGEYYLVRPGSAPGISEDEAIKNVSDALNKTITASQSTMVLLDAMPGEGDQIGWTFDQISKMIEGADMPDKVGVCLDCAAVWAAGYDIKGDLDGVLDEFDRKIGLGKLRCVHLNDSKEERGSRVDRHERIGQGKIGFAALSALVNDPRLAGRAFYLEEPHSTLVVYEEDVARFRSAAE